MLLCRKHNRAVHEDGFTVEVVVGSARSEIRFRRRDGRPLPEAPALPRPASDPGATVRLQHAANAYRINPWTAAPRAHPRDQGRMNLDDTMIVLLGREAARREKGG